MYPSNPKLATASLEMFQRYADYLMGPRVWGMVSLDAQMQPVSSPHIDHVLAYDRACRQFAADAMNSGVDIQSAYEKALADPDTRQLYFITPLSIDSNTKKCTDCTAPGLDETHPRAASSKGQAQGTKRGTDSGAPPPPPVTSPTKKSRHQRKKATAQKQKEENERLKLQLSKAYNNGGGPKQRWRQRRRQRWRQNGW